MKHLLMLSYGASGTNALFDQLLNNKNIYFHKRKEPLNILNDVKLKEDGYWKDKIQTLMDAADDKKLLIHVKPEHLKRLNLPLVDFIGYCKDGFDFIVLKRKNYLARQSGSEVKELFKKYGKEYINKKINIHTNDLLISFIERDKTYAEILKLVNPYAHIYLEYEKNIQKNPREAADMVAKYFHFYEDYIYERKKKTFNAQKNRFSDMKLSDKIENFEEVKRVLTGTQYEWMLWE